MEEEDKQRRKEAGEGGRVQREKKREVTGGKCRRGGRVETRHKEGLVMHKERWICWMCAPRLRPSHK